MGRIVRSRVTRLQVAVLARRQQVVELLAHALAHDVMDLVSHRRAAV